MSAILGIDLGGTKLAFAVFSTEGIVLDKQTINLDGRPGADVGLLIIHQIKTLIESYKGKKTIVSVGISVPGIVNKNSICAPNIPGWENYPLHEEVRLAASTTHHVFSAYVLKDETATEVIQICIDYWGTAIANLISFFDPKKIVLGGSLFGPVVRFISKIERIVSNWVQPLSFKKSED